MAIFPIGAKYYNGKQSDVYIVTGNIIREAEKATTKSGKMYGKASVAARENKDGTTDFVTLYGWRDHMSEVLCLHKGSNILCVGVINENDYNGKKYLNMDVDFIAVSGAGCYSGVSQSIEDVAAKFTELTEESEEKGQLPF